MPTWAWGTLKFLGNSEQWAANVRFLEASIARGDAFLLSTSAYPRSS
ncbi:hypothetical protein TRIP_D300211 [uncultured Paludibacter sp.]|uniref:Uncharacterized protein n=1 Tax=uncultured Paludibacter sp. TaxID=497635 RepID=A0A653ABE0_9BACT|nr:hypothetical protein TRIP_D300211 [uncultured Paludibacter sp.]